MQKCTEVWVLFDNNELYLSLLTQIVLMMKITIHYYKYYNTVGCLTVKKIAFHWNQNCLMVK